MIESLSRLRLLALLFAFGGLLFGLADPVLELGPQSAFAQDGEDDAADEEAAEEDDEGAESEAPKTYLGWMFKALGIWVVPLLILSFAMISLIGMNLFQVRRGVLLPDEFVESFDEKLSAKDYQGAFNQAQGDDSLVANVLEAGLQRLGKGYDEALEAMQEVGEDEAMRHEHRLSWLATIGAVAPMVGLMGTVAGMIESFRTIATSETAPSPSELADGISTALFTTLAGLAIAIPAMIFYGFLRNRLSRLMLETGIVSERFMSRLPNPAAKKAAAKS